MVNSNKTNKRKRAVLEFTTRSDRTKPETLSIFEALDVVTRQIATSPAIDVITMLNRQFTNSRMLEATALFGRQVAESPAINAMEILGRQLCKSPIFESFEILGQLTAASPTIRAISGRNNQTIATQLYPDVTLLNRVLASSLVPQIESIGAVVRALAPAPVASAIVADMTLKPGVFTRLSPRPTVETDVGPQDLAAQDLKFGSPVPQPTMRPFLVLFDRLITDVDLRRVSRKPFADGYCTYAVEQAWKCVNKLVKKKSGFTGKDGADLMRRVFSPEKPVLYLSALQSESGQNEQRGYMDIFAGAMTGIRNPRAHDYELVDDPGVALEMLILANHLLRKLRIAVKVMN